VPWTPSRRQTQFLGLDAEEAFFGGSVGGGKSVALLYDALKNVDVPGYIAGLFRLTDEDWAQPDSLLARCREWFADTPARWEASTNSFRFPSGALIHFGSGHNGHMPSFRRAYEGISFQMLGFDELPQWPEALYRFLIGSRLRPGENKRHVPLRARGTGNPGGQEWVRERFIDAAALPDGRTYREDWTGLIESGEPIPTDAVYQSPPSSDAEDLAAKYGRKAQGAFFVPSFLDDNPGFDGERGADYRMRLVTLDPVTRAQTAGDWWVNAAGKLFRPEWFQYLETEPAGLEWLRSWDLAGTAATKPGDDPAFTAGSKVARWPDPTDPRRVRIVVSDLQHFRADPGGTEDRVLTTANEDGPLTRIMFEQEPGSAGKSVVATFRRLLPGHQVEAMTKSGPKEEYWRPLSALASSKLLYFVRGPWNRVAVDQLKELPASKKKDIADSMAQATWRLLGFSREMLRDRVKMPTAKGGLRSVDL
jgi:phage terminase large subunit-like protein